MLAAPVSRKIQRSIGDFPAVLQVGPETALRKYPMNPASCPLDRLLADIRGCVLCADTLPLGPRPVLRATVTARILIAGQAPGTRVHDTGIPFNDRSGDRLRQWLGIGPEVFYDQGRIAILPMGFCYPGVLPGGGDRPPEPRCAATWRAPLLAALPQLRLTLLVGSYAQAYHLGRRRAPTLTETVRRFADYLPAAFPLPHPSWRNTGWLKRNPWFEDDALPVLRARVSALL